MHNCLRGDLHIDLDGESDTKDPRVKNVIFWVLLWIDWSEFTLKGVFILLSQTI